MREPATRTCRGAVAGAAGGAAGSAAMTASLALLRHALNRSRRVRHAQHSLLRGTRSSEWTSQVPGGRDDATVRAATRAYRLLFRRRLGRRARRWAGPLMHYAFGAAVGGIYGALAARTPQVERGRGLAFGTAVWLAADEVLDPVLGLTEPPWRNPWYVHAWALGAHLVYGATTDLVRRRLAPDAPG